MRRRGVHTGGRAGYAQMQAAYTRMPWETACADSALAVPDCHCAGAAFYIQDTNATVQERPTAVHGDDEHGTFYGFIYVIDCGIVRAFEEAVWHKLTASKAAHRERWQAIMNEVRQLEQECKDLQKLKQYLARKEDDRVCQACTGHGANAVACWSKVLPEDMLVDNAVCRGLKVQRELDADVFLRCVRDKHHRYVHMLHGRRNDGAETMEALALQTHGVCMRQSNALRLSEPKKYMDTLIQQHRAKTKERQTLCVQMKKRNQQYFKLDNEADNQRFDRIFRRVSKRCNKQQQRSNPEARQEEQSHDTRRRGRKRKTDPDRADADREQDRLSKKKMKKKT